MIAVPTGDGALVRELSDLARDVGLEVRVVPSVRELLGGDVARRRPPPARPRPTCSAGTRSRPTSTRCPSTSPASGSSSPAPAGRSAPSSAASSRRSSPSALDHGRPRRVRAAQRAALARRPGDARLRQPVLIDIRDRARVTRLFAEIKPDVVFHAAALKHLPLLQAHPSEALKSNVWGTLSVLDAAAVGRRQPLRQHLHRQGGERGQRARLLEAGGRGPHLALRPAASRAPT